MARVVDIVIALVGGMDPIARLLDDDLVCLVSFFLDVCLFLFFSLSLSLQQVAAVTHTHTHK